MIIIVWLKDLRSIVERLKIYFLGSGDIAVPVLGACMSAPELELVGVGTQPDRAAGRRGKLSPTPVGRAAVAAGLSPDKPENVNAPEFIAKLRTLAPEMVVVVSFGQLLRSELLELPRYGCVNVHASLLPRYRGASPIVQAILHRDKATGVCFMHMERGLDTGAVYRTFEYPLRGDEYADVLEVELGELAGRTIAATLTGIAAGTFRPVEQDDAAATVCRKIRKDDAWIDWRRSAEEIGAMVRAYHPWPGARCRVSRSSGESVLTLRKVEVLRDRQSSPGEVCIPDRRTLIVGCGSGAVRIAELTPENSKTMDAAAFLNGLRGEKIGFLLPDD
jgi:methionyl-tRNA formyltransferase